MQILGTLFQLGAVFLAFLAGAIGFRLIEMTRGGLASKAIKFLVLGILCLVLAFGGTFIGISTGKLYPFEPSLFWPIITFLFFLGFGLSCLGQWILFKRLS